MARNLFGGTSADVAESVSGARIPGAVGTVWDGPSEGARQITDLTDSSGAPVLQLVADNRGMVPPFYGPPAALSGCGLTSGPAGSDSSPRTPVSAWSSTRPPRTLTRTAPTPMSGC